MAAKRVVVFPMGDCERALVRRFMRVEEETPSVMYGLVVEGVERLLRAKNILFEEQPRATNPPRDTLALPDDAPVAEGPCVIETHGPLTRAREEVLATLGVTVHECVSGYRYAASIRSPDVAGIRGVSWLLSLVSRDPTRRRSSTLGEALEQDDRVRFDDVIQRWDLYATSDNVDSVVRALESAGARLVAGPEGRRLRVRATARAVSALAKQFSLDFERRMPIELAMDHARKLARAELPAAATAGVASVLDGRDVIVAVADSGIEKKHPTFTRADGTSTVNIVFVPNSDRRSADLHGHGTHVASTIVGSGAGSPDQCYRGVAPGASLVFQAIANNRGELDGLPLDGGELLSQAYKEGARVHNNSWSERVAARYTRIALDFDRFVYEHPDMLVVVAAGNTGTQRDPGFVLDPEDEPPPVELRSLGAPATAKNVLTVGAQRSDRTDGPMASKKYSDAMPERFFRGTLAQELFSGDSESLAAFSARGPADDDRIKPDLVAPGTSIAAAALLDLSKNTRCEAPAPRSNRYALMSGTSMATPIVSGAAAIVMQYFKERRAHPKPTAALVRATLVNGTRALTGADAVFEKRRFPNPNQGFGALDLACSLGIDPVATLAFVDESQGTALDATSKTEAKYFAFELAFEGPLRITLAYNDLPARAVQHVLDLHLRVPSGEKYFGNHRGAFVDGRGTGDAKNNVKVLRFAAAQPGRYLLRVVHYGFDRAPQPFALVVSGPLASDVLGAVGDEGGSFQ